MCARRYETKGRDGFCFALNPNKGQLAPNEMSAGCLPEDFARQNLAWLSGLHQPRGEIHIIAQHTIGPAFASAISSGARPALAEADLNIVNEAQLGNQCLQFQRGRRRPDGIVFVRERRAKNSIEIDCLCRP